jgi:serralysin
MTIPLSTQVQPPVAVADAPVTADGLCGERLRIVLRSGPAATVRPGRCLRRIVLSRGDLTFVDRFRRLRLHDPKSGSGVWSTSFAHGPQTGPRAWDSHTLPGNHEQQIYVDPQFAGSGDAPLGLDPYRRGRGGLSILARPTPKPDLPALWNYRYVSGLLTTQPSFAQQFGYFEVRAQLPAGRGLWPAVWMLPSGGGWPPELDILEQTGGDTVFQTLHMKAASKPAEADFKTHIQGLTHRFHTFGLLWTPERLVWFIDRRQTAATPTPPDLNQPMYLLINLAVGGDFPGPPGRTTRWPARFRIADVRAYRWSPPRRKNPLGRPMEYSRPP